MGELLLFLLSAPNRTYHIVTKNIIQQLEQQIRGFGKDMSWQKTNLLMFWGDGRTRMLCLGLVSAWYFFSSLLVVISKGQRNVLGFGVAFLCDVHWI